MHPNAELIRRFYDGRPVHNQVDARFEFRDGKIIRHRDRFDVWTWAGQALGPVERLLGWSSLIKNRIRTQAAGNLERFMQKETDSGLGGIPCVGTSRRSTISNHPRATTRSAPRRSSSSAS